MERISSFAASLERRLRAVLIALVKWPIRVLGFDIQRYTPDHLRNSPPFQLKEVVRSFEKLRALSNKHANDSRYSFVEFCRRNIHYSMAQRQQDLFVQFQNNEKRKGYFLEFGAGDGMSGSNTYMLEKHYRWGGILSEPGKIWHPALVKNRGCIVDFRCVWDKSGQQLDFVEAIYPALSTIASFSASDMHAAWRQNGKHYLVDTISLNDMLEEWNAPRLIDYLSIDTEGSEFRILSAFDFDKYDIRVITVEHNHTSQREKIFDLLSSKGFIRKYEEFSGNDDWFVKLQ